MVNLELIVGEREIPSTRGLWVEGQWWCCSAKVI